MNFPVKYSLPFPATGTIAAPGATPRFLPAAVGRHRCSVFLPCFAVVERRYLIPAPVIRVLQKQCSGSDRPSLVQHHLQYPFIQEFFVASSVEVPTRALARRHASPDVFYLRIEHIVEEVCPFLCTELYPFPELPGLRVVDETVLDSDPHPSPSEPSRLGVVCADLLQYLGLVGRVSRG